MNVREWVRPQTVAQRFVANEYVAACGDSGTVYKFECNAGQGVTHTDWFGQTTKYVWRVYDSNGNNLTGNGTYGPCGTTHSAESTDDFINGYIDNIYTSEKENIPVIIWTEGGTNIHCTTDLDMSTWETEKS